jgi:hypothetical protein
MANYYKIFNCKKFKEFKLGAAVKLTKTKLSFNRPVSCSLCVNKNVFWIQKTFP